MTFAEQQHAKAEQYRQLADADVGRIITQAVKVSSKPDGKSHRTMSRRTPTPVEKAMAAHAASRVDQATQSDKMNRTPAEQGPPKPRPPPPKADPEGLG
jgi:hypothetical protein